MTARNHVFSRDILPGQGAGQDSHAMDFASFNYPMLL